MKNQLLILSSLIAGAWAVQPAAAQDSYANDPQAYPKTRQEVKAELQRAQAAGEIPKGDVVVPDAKKRAPASTTTRAEVKAELQRANAAGEMPKGDVVVPDAKKRQPQSTTSREEVKAEIERARVLNEMPKGDRTKPQVSQDPAPR